MAKPWDRAKRENKRLALEMIPCCAKLDYDRGRERYHGRSPEVPWGYYHRPDVQFRLMTEHDPLWETRRG